MNDSLKKEIFDWIKDIVIAAVIISVIMGALYAYTGTWPPMVVVESESMQHSDDTSYIGVIDTGDIVLSKHISSKSDIITYVEGRATGYRSYGDYGDVIIYEPYGRHVTPIIHRAVLYLRWNSTGGGYDAPGLKNLKYDEDYTVTQGDGWRNIHGRISIYNYGYEHRTLTIPISTIINYFQLSGKTPHDGYITAGDHNIAKGYGTDQPIICREPIKFSWIVGKAEGELPWFGIIKLMFSGTLGAHPAPANSWVMLIISIALLIIVPMIAENLWDKWKEKRGNGEESGEKMGEDEGEELSEIPEEDNSDKTEEKAIQKEEDEIF